MSDHRERPSRRPWRTNAEWDRLRSRIDAAAGDPPLARRRDSRPILWAAAAALVAAIGLWQFSSRRDQSPFVQVATRAGERRTIQLDDSSIVTLGPETSLRYRLGARSRDVELTGLANFQVTHDAARPFVVRAKNAIATDLGTEFIVHAYAGDTTVLVTVTSGRVGLSSSEGSSVALSASERGSVSRAGNAISDGSAKPSDMAWVRGVLAFNDAPMRDVAVELSRWFGTSVSIPDAALAERRITAQYVQPTLDDVLSALTQTLHVRADRRAGAIVLSPVAR